MICHVNLTILEVLGEVVDEDGGHLRESVVLHGQEHALAVRELTRAHSRLVAPAEKLLATLLQTANTHTMYAHASGREEA